MSRYRRALLKLFALVPISTAAMAAGARGPGSGTTPPPRQRMPYPGDAPADPAGPQVGGRRLNLDRMLDYLPASIKQSFRASGVALLRDGRLDPALREMAIVRTGWLSRCVYEVYHHAPAALKAGLPRAVLDSLSTAHPAGLSAPQAAVVRFVDELCREASPSDTALRELRRHLADADVVELILVVGLYMTTARVVNTTGIAPEDAALDFGAFLAR